MIIYVALVVSCYPVHSFYQSQTRQELLRLESPWSLAHLANIKLVNIYALECASALGGDSSQKLERFVNPIVLLGHGNKIVCGSRDSF